MAILILHHRIEQLAFMKSRFYAKGVIMKSFVTLCTIMLLAVGANVMGALNLYCGYDYAGDTIDGQSSGNDIGLLESWSASGFGLGSGSLDYPLNAGFSTLGNRVVAYSSVQITGSRQMASAAEIDLGVDKDYYISYLLRKDGNRYVGFQLNGVGVPFIEMGIGHGNDFRVCVEDEGCVEAEFDAVAGSTYLIVCKIEARVAEDDKIYMKIYENTEAVDINEPLESEYDVSNSANLGGTYDTVLFRSNAEVNLEVDELRIGDYWYDVAYGSPEFAYDPYPANGATAVATDPELNWQSANSSATYDVYFGTDPNSLSQVATSISETSWPLSSLSVGTQYFWRVDTVSGATVVTSEVWTFTTAGKAENPKPENNSENNSVNPQLTWSGNPLSDSYDIYFGDSAQNLNFVSNVTEESYQITDALNEDSVYFWRIDTLDSEGNLLETGDVWQFTTGSLFAYWKLDKDSGTNVENAITTGVDGTIVAPNNDYSREAGVLGKALRLSPIDQTNDNGPRIELQDIGSNAGINTDKATIGMWLYLDGPQQDPTGLFINRGTGTGFWMAGSNRHLRYMWDGGNYGSDITLPLNKWVYLAWVVEPNKASFYLFEDGEVRSWVNSQSHGLNAFSGPTRIGAEVLPRDRFFKGLIDEVRVYNRPLNLSEVQDVYEQSSIAKYPNPLNGEINVPTDLTLEWMQGTGMVSQDVYLSTDPDFTGESPVATGVVSESWPISDLDLDMEYYWRVDTVTDANSIQGNVWSFETIPPKAYDPTPSNDAVDVAPDQDLSWTPAPGGPYEHQVYLSTDLTEVNERQAAAYQGEFSSATFDPADLEWNTKYYWAVDEYDGANLYSGELWNFTTITPVCDPPLAADLNGDCIVTMDDFSVMALQWLQCNLVPVEACP
ncbi:LamG-like jellyroll fold domain-containing protein [Sedimentisphaera cyanobacteriorum]|nr:LamG-like jellyroll fold domain-containing protein [Sedimentisphaera cyanobacteriorum]